MLLIVRTNTNCENMGCDLLGLRNIQQNNQYDTLIKRTPKGTLASRTTHVEVHEDDLRRHPTAEPKGHVVLPSGFLAGSRVPQISRVFL